MGDSDDEEDVPIRVDFRDPSTARTWIADTRIRRPYRPRFFAAFCAALSSRRQLRILELGSGPGQLAREVLVHCDVHTYVALDFSPAMHEIATEYLGELASRATFVIRDFREPTWPTMCVASALSESRTQCSRAERKSSKWGGPRRPPFSSFR